MIYLIYGPDRRKAQAAAEALLAAEFKKFPELAVFRFSVDDYSLERLEEVCVGQTLFAQKFAVVLDGLWASAGELFSRYLSDLSVSSNLYLLVEEAPEPDVLEQVSTAGGEVKKVAGRETSKSVERTPSFNLFAVGDALAERDRRRAWVLFQTALARGLAPEEIFWKLVWKIKTLLLVQTAADPVALGFKPFVLQQSRRHSRNFKLTELKQLSARLVALWHDSRRGLTDFELGLERLILEI
ncbi:MAG: hypothetical protein HYT46_03670 [Candidatus Vogelbacteria bacterium]|nr:hypothetical protein [Candidatus Vogelbacteria bacterium]